MSVTHAELRKAIRRATVLLLVFLATGLSACLSTGIDEEVANVPVVEEAPLAGEALAQRRVDLERAWRDLVHFETTMASMTARRDSHSLSIFDDFLSEYIGSHLDPMLKPMWQSTHPELMAVDAKLRLMKADILAKMRYPRRVQDTIEDIRSRFPGRRGMLVEFPAGEQRSLGEAVEMIEERKWNS